VLRRHPAVLEAAVTGVADPAGILGRVLKAWVVPAVDPPPHPEEIVSHCARHLEPHKVPRLVEFCRRLPKSILGKTGRGMLEERPEVQSPTVVGGRGKRG
jgi:acyl-coenzyme A synthetase/AMP-(fatty) acid ligase